MRISLPSRVMVCWCILAFCALSAVEANATTRRVPADYPTIQQAINASVNGDTVLVSPGTYVENINFLGKAITVTSEAGPQATIIDGNQLDAVVTFHSGESRSAVLKGFTIQNGNATGEGGGVNIVLSSPTVTNNLIINNLAETGGGGIGINFGSPLIQNNIIKKNRQTPAAIGGSGGGGISVGGFGSAQIIGNTISENAWSFGGGGMTLNASGPALVKNNLITDNEAFRGGGLYLINFSPAILVQNLIARNRADDGAGIYWSSPVDSIVNNTIVDNDGRQGSGMHVIAGAVAVQTNIINNVIRAKAGQIAVLCADLNPQFQPRFKFTNAFSQQGVAFDGGCSGQLGMNGNISADPLFMNPAVDDYHLQTNSPSIDTGDNSAPNLPSTDLDGKPRIQDGNHDGIAIVDMGAYEAPPPFDLCIQDESNGNLLQVNTSTGDYQFTNCAGLTIGGKGTLTKRGNQITLQHNATDRRVMASVDTSSKRATASVQFFSQGRTFSITDRNIANNPCSCS
ncbi:MAG: serine protease [Blastocatellia bacterium]